MLLILVLVLVLWKLLRVVLRVATLFIVAAVRSLILHAYRSMPYQVVASD